MKELNITVNIHTCSYNELNNREQKLVEESQKITQHAYAPYSGFRVGAALLLDNGVILTGSNQENAAYPSGLCAERTALFYANSQYPNRAIVLMAITAFTGENFVPFISPCGACRQVLLEAEMRFKNSIRILLCGTKQIYVISSARDLLPLAFDKIDYSIA